MSSAPPPTGYGGMEEPPLPRGGGGGGGPLAGVPNVEELPQPEALSAAAVKDVGALEGVFGEYLLRCLMSKSWALRDAALHKIRLDIEKGIYPSLLPDTHAPPCFVIRIETPSPPFAHAELVKLPCLNTKLIDSLDMSCMFARYVKMRYVVFARAL